MGRFPYVPAAHGEKSQGRCCQSLPCILTAKQNKDKSKRGFTHSPICLHSLPSFHFCSVCVDQYNSIQSQCMSYTRSAIDCNGVYFLRVTSGSEANNATALLHHFFQPQSEGIDKILHCAHGNLLPLLQNHAFEVVPAVWGRMGP